MIAMFPQIALVTPAVQDPHRDRPVRHVARPDHPLHHVRPPAGDLHAERLLPRDPLGAGEGPPRWTARRPTRRSARSSPRSRCPGSSRPRSWFHLVLERLPLRDLADLQRALPHRAGGPEATSPAPRRSRTHAVDRRGPRWSSPSRSSSSSSLPAPIVAAHQRRRQGLKGNIMAEIVLDHVVKRYPDEPSPWRTSTSRSPTASSSSWSAPRAREVDDAEHDRGAGGHHHRRPQDRRHRRERQGAEGPRTSRWCSSPTRSTRTCGLREHGVPADPWPAWTSPRSSRRSTRRRRLLELEQHLTRKPSNLSGGPASARGRWAARSCAARRPSSWTSRCRTSTRSCALQMRTQVARIQKTSAPPRSTSPTTRPRRYAGRPRRVMRAGQDPAGGLPTELYDHPNNLFVAGFIGSPSITSFPRRSRAKSLSTAIGELPVPDAYREALPLGSASPRRHRGHPPRALRGRLTRRGGTPPAPGQRRRRLVEQMGLGRLRVLHGAGGAANADLDDLAKDTGRTWPARARRSTTRLSAGVEGGSPRAPSCTSTAARSSVRRPVRGNLAHGS